jgi:iron uptake system component EfeO
MRRSTIAVITALTLGLAACSGSSGKAAGPGTTVTVPNPTSTSTSTSTTVAGGGGPGATAVATYRTYVEKEAADLVTSTASFVQAVDQGDVGEAKRLFPGARQYYERIEPIAERFGPLDPQIDARANDVSAFYFEGFHRIERQLWQAGNLNGMTPVANALAFHVSELQVQIPGLALDPELLAAGAVELLNEIATSKITGEEDRYSHTDLWDFNANLQGSQEAIDALRPLIAAKSPQLPAAIDAAFAATFRLLDHYRRGDGFVLYTALNQTDTRALAAQVDALGDVIAKVRPLVGTS